MIESKYLKDSIQNIQQLLSIPSLRKFETRQLATLARLSKVRRYDAGEEIIREGDTDPWLYFLLSGSVVVKKGDVEICTLNQIGEIFGEMRILDSLSRSASVFALNPTACLAVNTAASDRIPSDDETARFLLLLYRVFAEFMSIRLRATSEELMSAKKRIQDLEG